MAYVEVVEEKIEDVIQVGTPARAADSVKMSTLIKDVQDKITRLVKAEIELAKDELKQKLKDSAVAIALFAAAAFLLFFVFTALVGALAAALATALPLWGAFLSTALILLLLAALLALAGKRFLSLSQAERFDAPENVKTDLNRIKFALRRHRVKVKVNEDLIVPLDEVPQEMVVDDGLVAATVVPDVVERVVVAEPSVVAEPIVVSESAVVVEPTVVSERTIVAEPVVVQESAVVAEPTVVSETVIGTPTVVSEAIVGRPSVITEEVEVVPGPIVAEPIVVSDSDRMSNTDTVVIEQIVSDDDGETE